MFTEKQDLGELLPDAADFWLSLIRDGRWSETDRVTVTIEPRSHCSVALLPRGRLSPATTLMRGDWRGVLYEKTARREDGAIVLDLYNARPDAATVTLWAIGPTLPPPKENPTDGTVPKLQS